MQKCDEYSNFFIKNLIFKEKVVIFNKFDCEYSKKAENLFYENFNHKPTKVNLKDLEIPTERINKIAECLYLRTKDNILPKIYLNGMYLGNFKDVENMQYRKDLNIYF